MHTKIVNVKEYSNDEVSLFTQAILTELFIIFLIISIFTDIFKPVLYILISLLMFNMAYNNAKFFKRKRMTIIYIVIGLFVLISTIMELL